MRAVGKITAKGQTTIPQAIAWCEARWANSLSTDAAAVRTKLKLRFGSVD